MKKILGILALVLILGIIPGVFADDENTVDANTLEEVKLIASPYGAEVRLIQLEKSITKNILVGAKVIEIIEKNHSEFDLTDAESKLNELEALLEEVKEYSLEEKDRNTIVSDFVAMKKEAVTLTQEFRTLTKNALESEDIVEVKDAIKELDLKELNNINQAIKNAIRTHNAERTQTMLEILGIENPELIQSIIDGNTTKQEVKDTIKEAFSDLNAQERIRVRAEIRETINKRIISEKSLIQQAKTKGLQRFLQIESQRMQRLSNWLENKANNLNENGFEKRAERLQGLSDRIEKGAIKKFQTSNKIGKN